MRLTSLPGLASLVLLTGAAGAHTASAAQAQPPGPGFPEQAPSV